ncbi:MAG TPA: SDR family NAD(P)-dependent oxidoreductase [Gaiellaceae bacterium]|nr:SDR family NAD(P)-dependent oxidoreductase [Gaiellaceae bacterium]
MAERPEAVLITGAATGIGAAAARKLAERGFRVFAGVHTTRPASPTAGVETVTIDVTDPGSVAAAAADVRERLGGSGLRAVVNNAGVIVHGPLELLPHRELERQFAINTLGPVYVTQAFLPLLRVGNGRLINVSAPTARVSVPFMGPIGASKAALESLSTALRGELAAWKIPVVLIEPGGTDTEIFAKAAATAEAALASGDPARVALYRPQLEAFAKAAAKQSLGPIEPVAAALVAAVEARRPKRRYSAGNGVRLFAALSHVPTGLRERLVASAFGLNRVAVDAR